MARRHTKVFLYFLVIVGRGSSRTIIEIRAFLCEPPVWV
ncbi:hypothetical protein COLO4_28977 [Corchorus olitorius]|uniref:Uncharacterized protein n=1 Tax=Corchorus olitorius TaxID=93759 RepID=A0A1R3HH66_9ROSI|nr:hypothetical protein COLO4_28977 [Corchorus olitorius]